MGLETFSRRVLALVGDAFFPRRCAGCDLVDRGPVCAACLGALAQLPQPPPRTEAGHRWLAAYEYRDPARALIQHGKFRRALPGLRMLADLAAERCAPSLSLAGGCLVAVPLGPRRQRQRGYNQAAVIAAALAAPSGLRRLEGLVRLRETRPQSEQNGAGREQSVRDAFAWRGSSLSSSHLWVVDDVVTTGATARAAARALLDAGAAGVDVVSLAAVP